MGSGGPGNESMGKSLGSCSQRNASLLAGFSILTCCDSGIERSIYCLWIYCRTEYLAVVVHKKSTSLHNPSDVFFEMSMSLATLH
jgi:hypothetical protein